MIDKTQELVDVVTSLHAAIDDLPDLKNIEINITGDAVETLQLIKEDIGSLDDRTIEVNIVYKNIGGPEEIKAATQVVQQVVIPASDTMKEQTQIVKDVNENAGNMNLNPEQTQAAADAMHNYTDQEDAAAEAATRLGDDVRQTTSSIQNLEDMTSRAAANVENVKAATDDYASADNNLANTVDRVNQALDNGDMTVVKATRNLSQLVYSTDDASKAQDSFAAAVDNIRSHLDDAGLTVSQTVAVMSRLKYIEDQAGISATNLANAQRDSESSTEDMATVSEMLARTLATSADATNRLGQSDLLLNEATKTFAGVTADAIPLWETGSGIFGAWNSHIQLFAGTLTAMGIPSIIATAGTIHILLDSILEISSTLIPAAIAFGAFAIAAAGDVDDIAKRMQGLFNVTVAYGQAIYPFTGALAQMQAAVQPEVYILFGEALQIMTKNTGAFTQLAQGAGKVLDDLGARIVVAINDGSGFSTFLKNATADLAGWGNLIGNIFGILGNVLKTLPGYGQLFLQVADDFTHFVETLTSSGVVQWILSLGLAFHGFILWAGLAVTGAVYLGDALVGLGVKVGLVDADFVLFNAAQFGLALRAMGEEVVALGGALITMAGAEDIAAAATGLMDAAFAAMAAVNPFVWIGLAIAGLVSLALWLGRSTTASDGFTQGLNAMITSAPNLGAAMQDVSNDFSITRQNIASTQNTINTLTAQMDTVSKGLDKGRRSADDYSAAWRNLNGQLQAAQGQQNANEQELQTLSNYQNNYNILLKAAGGNVSFLSEAQITENDIMNAGTNTVNNQTSAMQKMVVEVQSAADAQKALALGTGRAAAALNAQTNLWLTETVPALQKVTQAEDTVINTILGGEQAFIGFEQGLQTMGNDAKVAGASIGGLNSQSLTLASDFYSSSIPAAQKMIDALQNEGVSSKDLTAVVATTAGQLSQFAGTNVEARTVIVDLINNALGPGTVSLQSLNKWIGQNSTSLQGMNGIVAKATIDASQLADTLNGQLDAALSEAIIQANGGTQAFTSAADAVKHADGNMQSLVPTATSLANVLLNDLGGNVDQTKSKFIDFYEKMGLTQSQANTLWQEISGRLTPAMQALGGQAINVKNDLNDIPRVTNLALTEKGSGNFSIAGVPAGLGGPVGHSVVPGAPESAAAKKAFGNAQGGMLAGYGGGDIVPAWLEPGELIVPKELAKHVAPVLGFAPGSARGYAGGGIVGLPTTISPTYSGDMGGLGPWSQNNYNASINIMTEALASNMENYQNQLAQQYAALSAGPLGGATGSMIANGTELFNYLLTNVFAGHKIAAAGAIASIWGECVTEDHQILTKRGYLNHDEVTTDDETIGYNPETNRSEWTRITRVLHYEKKQVVTLDDGKWSSTFTPNHRWLTEDGLKKYIDMKDDDHIILSKEADTGDGLPISKDEAVYLGLLASRGHAKGYDIPIDLVVRAGDAKLDALYQVLNMSSEQRKAWLSAVLATDLPQEEREVIHTELRKDNVVANAIELALYFEGYHRDMKVPEEKTVSGFEDVWCVSTELGSWTAKKDAFAFLTGNSEWNPYTSGTGGRGLIGWTPEGTISNAAFSGGMRTQEPAIIAFINSSGDEGVIREMMSATSVLEAANEWGKGVERYGINDVHAEGIALATSIMNGAGNAAPGKQSPAQGLADTIARVSRGTQDAGGFIYPGRNIIDNNTGRIERTMGPNDGGGEVHVHLHMNDKELAHEIFPAIQQEGFRYASRNNGNASNKGQWSPR